MEKIDEKLGKELCDNYFKVGNWYCFIEGKNKVYMKIEKFIYRKNQPKRVFFKGKGFSTIDDRMYTPRISKEETCIYCWAKDQIEHTPLMSEEQVKEKFTIANQKIYELYF